MPEQVMGGRLPSQNKARSQVEVASPAIDPVHLEEGSPARRDGAVDDPLKEVRPEAQALRRRVYLDKFEPGVAVAQPQIHSTDALAVVLQDEHVVALDDRGE